MGRVIATTIAQARPLLPSSSSSADDHGLGRANSLRYQSPGSSLFALTAQPLAVPGSAVHVRQLDALRRSQLQASSEPHLRRQPEPIAPASTRTTTADRQPWLVGAASDQYGGTVNLTATLTSSGSGVSNKTIMFTLNGNPVGQATTDGSGVAALGGSALGLNAGTYGSGVDATFAADSNYSASNGNNTLSVAKADATVSVTGYTGVYDGAAHGATGTATGVGGEALSGLDLGDSFTNVPGGTANWTFTDATGNYNDASGTAAIVITKADATVRSPATRASMTARRTARPARRRASAATALSGPEPRGQLHQRARRHGDLDLHRRDRQLQQRQRHGGHRHHQGGRDGHGQRLHGRVRRRAHGATGTATGVGGAALSGLDLGRQLHQRARRHGELDLHRRDRQLQQRERHGGHRHHQGGRDGHRDGYTGVYDGAAHGATGTATGVGGAALSGPGPRAPASPTCPAARRPGPSPTRPATTTTPAARRPSSSPRRTRRSASTATPASMTARRTARPARRPASAARR